MRLTKLSARGLKGLAKYPNGIDLAIDALPEGLIALVGPNGGGKTTTLEAPFAALYGEFPSRPTKSLADAADSRDAFIDTTIDCDERGVFRARVSIDAVSRSLDAVLERTRNGQREILNDGKISTFHQAVAEHFPAPALVLGSAFHAQNKAGSFASLDKKGRRDFFSQLLGLDAHEARAVTARAATTIVDSQRATLRGQLDALMPLTSDTEAEAIHLTGNRLTARLLGTEQDRDQAQRVIAAIEPKLVELRAAAAAFDVATADREAQTQRLADRRAELTRLATDRRKASADVDDRAASITRTLEQALAREQRHLDLLETPAQLAAVRARRLEQITEKLTTRRDDLQARIKNNEALLERATAIRAAAEATDGLEGQLADARNGRTLIADELTRVQGLLEEARRALRDAETEDKDRARLQRATALLETVPCGGEGRFAACQFLTDARDAAAELRRMPASSTAACRETVDVHAGIVATTQTEVQRTEADIRRLEAAIAAAMPARDERTHLSVAETRVAERRAEIAALELDAAADSARAHEEHDAALRRVDAARARHEQALTDARQLADDERAALEQARRTTILNFDEREAAIAEDVAEIETALKVCQWRIDESAGAHDALLKGERDLTQARQLHAIASEALAGLQAERTAFEERRTTFFARVAQRDQVRADLAVVDQDLVEWQALARVFGREGLPVLEVAAAGPGVSELANDLLRSCFGGQFTLELVTQDAKAKGDGMKEVFELRVYDNTRGGEAKDLALCSGGEQVVIDEAFKAAVALYLNARHDRPIRTCFRDETTGALDPEAAPRYIAMLRRLQTRGGFSRIFFVCHNPAVAALADAQLVFGGPTVTTAYPPYAEVA